MSFINEGIIVPLISEINPFTMIFVSSGTLSYYSQLLHYDNYPELVYPIEMVCHCAEIL
jgi:hypothetical protein